MLADMLQWVEIRRRVRVDGVGGRQILREAGIHRKTRETIPRHSQPPSPRSKGPRPKPKLGPSLDRIAPSLDEDEDAPRKQRHTARRIFERPRDAGCEGGSSVVRNAVRRTHREAFVPPAHPPGEAQVDSGEAVAVVGGQPRKVEFFVMPPPPRADASSVRDYDRECTETF